MIEKVTQIEFCENDSIKNLSEILKKENVQKVLVFRGGKSYEQIKDIIEKELDNVEVQYYNDFSPNPKKEDVDRAILNIKKDYDTIIAVGGGSVMDFAKAFRFYTENDVKLIAIPTTCGTGAESTQFAVIYIDGIKKSLDNPSILPDYAIVDSKFVEENPLYLKASTSLDAFCQAIESYWAVGATEESRKYAQEALNLIKENIVEYVNSTNKQASVFMAKGSHLAGKAINISRTTASHAMSYTITSRYGIPHGHAVALTIAPLALKIKNVNNENVNDRRGVEYIKNSVNTIENILGLPFSAYFKNLFEEIHIEYDLEKLGIFDIDLIAYGVNEERLKNNPVKLSNQDIREILTTKWFL